MKFRKHRVDGHVPALGRAMSALHGENHVAPGWQWLARKPVAGLTWALCPTCRAGFLALRSIWRINAVVLLKRPLQDSPDYREEGRRMSKVIGSGYLGFELFSAPPDRGRIRRPVTAITGGSTVVPLERSLRPLAHPSHAVLDRCGHRPPFERPRDFAFCALRLLGQEAKQTIWRNAHGSR